MKLLLFLLLPLFLIPAFAQVVPNADLPVDIPNDPPSVPSIPLDNINEDLGDLICEKDQENKCKPGKKILIVAEYEKTNKSKLDKDFKKVKADKEKDLPQKSKIEAFQDSPDIDIISIEMEYKNSDGQKLKDFKAGITAQLATGATYFRIVEFDSWHDFPDENRPCEIISEADFGTPFDFSPQP